MLQAANAQSAAAGIPLQGGGLTRLPGLGVPAPDLVPPTSQLNWVSPQQLSSVLRRIILCGSKAMFTIRAPILPKVVPLCRPSSGGRRTRIAGRPVRNYRDFQRHRCRIGTSHTVRNSYRGNSVADFEKVTCDRSILSSCVRYSRIGRPARSRLWGVRYPGTFDIMRDERLSSLLAERGPDRRGVPAWLRFHADQCPAIRSRGNYREAVELQTGALTAATTPKRKSRAFGLPPVVGNAAAAPTRARSHHVTADPTILAVKPGIGHTPSTR